MEYCAIILVTLISGVVGTGLGGIIGALLNRESNKTASLLLSFAGGVMLAVVCFDLMQSSLHVFDGTTLEANAILSVAVCVTAGYLVVWGLNYLIDKKTNNELSHIDKDHPQTADDLDELIHSDHYEHHKATNGSLFVAGLVMMFAIALHNLPEGMVIGASYAKETDLLKSLLSSNGFIMAVVIGLHNIPEGMAVSVPLISGGMKKGTAILLTGLSGLPTVIGAVLGFFLGGLGPVALMVSLGFASGAMLYVILGELIPESVLMWKSKIPALFTLIGIIVGFILVE